MSAIIGMSFRPDATRYRLLVLGGSWFVGRALVRAAVGRGWRVTLFNRGRTPATHPDGVELVRGDRESEADLARLADAGPWDAAVDVNGAVPANVRDASRALAPVVGRYVLVSTISVYRDWPHAAVTEDSPVWDADPAADPDSRSWDPEAYGPLKAGCELAAAQVFGRDRLLVVRPHVVLGPHEYVGRLVWWLGRVRRGGSVLVPGPDRYVQPVDVRDLAVFVCDQVAAGVGGVFNVAAPKGRDTYGDLVRACVTAVGPQAERPAELVWVDEDWLVAQGVTQWTALPLWRNAAAPWAMDTTRAVAAGLRCRPLVRTAADTWTWLQAGGIPVAHERAAEQGLPPDVESRLLDRWAHSRPGRPELA